MDVSSISPEMLKSPAIQRLLQEIAVDEAEKIEFKKSSYNRWSNKLIKTGTYNRTHNRHNR